MSLLAMAEEAAGLWQGRVVRLIVNRENAVFEMRVPEGKAVLRLHRPGYQSDAAIRSELWWCGELAQAGLPVAAPLPILQPIAAGDHLAVLARGQRASTMSWVEGRALGAAGVPLDMPVPQQIAIFARLGAVLALLHRVTDGLTLPQGFARPAWDVAGLVGEAPLWNRFWDHPLANPAERALLIAGRDFLRLRLARHQAEGAVLAPVHADVLRENVLVDGQSVSLIDFDDSGIGFRLYDLGTALLQNLGEPAFPDLRAALMSGYGTTDQEMVDVFTLARCCASLGWTMTRLEPQHPVHASHLARACSLARVLAG